MKEFQLLTDLYKNAGRQGPGGDEEALQDDGLDSFTLRQGRDCALTLAAILNARLHCVCLRRDEFLGRDGMLKKKRGLFQWTLGACEM